MKWVFLVGWIALVVLAGDLLWNGHDIYCSFVLGFSTVPLQSATWRAIRDTGYNPAEHPVPPEANEGGGLHDPVTKETWIALGVIAFGLAVSALLGATGVLPRNAPGMFMIGLVVLMLAWRQLFLLACFAIACRNARRSDAASQ